MDTTIQISGELLEKLRNMKVYSRESYETIIWDLVEDRLELSKQTKANLEQSKKEIAEGETISLGGFEKKKRSLDAFCRIHKNCRKTIG